MSDPQLKPLVWVGSSKDELKAFPEQVRRMMGQALLMAQLGARHPDAKPLKGYRGAGVLEVVEEFAADAYRTVYTVKLGDVVYVLHAFQKRSKKGIATPKHTLDLISDRLRWAQRIHEMEFGSKKQKRRAR
jgi:phage-related protein